MTVIGVKVVVARRPELEWRRRGLHGSSRLVRRLRLSLVLSLVAALLPALTSDAGAAQQADVATFRGGVEIVRLPVTVRGADDRLLTTLSRDDFRIVVGGRPRPIEVFSTRTQPLALALLFNTCTDGEVLERYRAIGRAFVDALEPADRAAIGSFSHEIAISPFVTGDTTVLHRVLAEELWHGWGHPLGAAVDGALTALADQTGKRVVVIVGPEAAPRCLAHQPCIGVGAATGRARGEEVSVFGIRVQTAGANHRSGDTVRDMAVRTGGGYLRLHETDDLPQVIGEVVRALRHEYILGFTSPGDVRSQRIDVRAIAGSTVWLGRRLSAESR